MARSLRYALHLLLLLQYQVKSSLKSAVWKYNDSDFSQICHCMILQIINDKCNVCENPNITFSTRARSLHCIGNAHFRYILRNTAIPLGRRRLLRGTWWQEIAWQFWLFCFIYARGLLEEAPVPSSSYGRWHLYSYLFVPLTMQPPWRISFAKLNPWNN